MDDEYLPEHRTVRFTVTADDGVRLYLDGKLIIDKWKDQAATTYNSIKWINAGAHTIKMEYYEHNGFATAKLSWQPASSNGGYVVSTVSKFVEQTWTPRSRRPESVRHSQRSCHIPRWY